MKLDEHGAIAEAGRDDPETCEHYWIPNSGGRGGEPDFRLNRMMSDKPLMHVMCARCSARTWFTAEQWQAIPACEPPSGNGGA